MKNSELSKEFLDQLSPEEASFICAWEELYNDQEFQSKLLCLKLEKLIASEYSYNKTRVYDKFIEEPYENIVVERNSFRNNYRNNTKLSSFLDNADIETKDYSQKLKSNEVAQVEYNISHAAISGTQYLQGAV